VEVFAAKFNHADLSGSSFIAARVKESDFTSATMHNMDFTDAVFFKTNLQDIDAQGTNLENIFLLSHNIQNAAKQKITVKTGGTSKKHVTLVSSYGLIVEKKRLLLCQYSNKTNIIKWTLPGGLVKFKEDPADTLRRKVKEEAGVIASVKKIAGLHSKTTRRKSAEYHGIRVLYSAEITRGKIVDQCKWWDIKKINQLELTEIAEVGQSLISQ
ncbi:MAG: NUDIX domain-containing protein, partial [Candidatus Electrothrix sp. AW5]|nr:NUDIX domain-containing protein [Candidatus Electrothrix gigas]